MWGAMTPMNIAAGVVVALLVALWTRLTLRSIAQQPLLRKRNYLGEEVIGSGGLAIVSSSILGWLLLCWRFGLDWREGGILMVTTFWFGVLGLLDDIAGERQIKGWKGHGRALLTERKLTTGMVKALGGGIGALLLAAWATDGVVSVIIGALLIALSANAVNLLDVRPSRALKGFWLLTLISIALSHGEGWTALVPLWASTLAYAPEDFRRKAMLGDAGSNPLGACFGAWALLHWSSKAHWSLVIVWMAFHLYAEKRSLTEDIQHIAPLRWLDELGVRK